MDVRLPDGTIVRNVPDGITQPDLNTRIQASRGKQPIQKPDFEQEAEPVDLGEGREEGGFGVPTMLPEQLGRVVAWRVCG